MSRKEGRNVAASVRQKLLNQSRERGEDFQFFLTRVQPFSSLHEQSILPGQPARWRWHLIPEREGRHDVELTLTLHVRLEDEGTNVRLEGFRYDVYVAVTPGLWLLTFVRENLNTILASLLTALLLTLCAAVWKKRHALRERLAGIQWPRRRRRPPDPPPAPTPTSEEVDARPKATA